MNIKDVALLVLAGGRSERFGRQDKLMADLDGSPLGLHVPQRLAPMEWAARYVVTSGPLTTSFTDLGFIIVPPVPEGGMGDNIAQGVRALPPVKGVLVCLADMPFVTRRHIRSLLGSLSSGKSIAVSETGGHISPPVLFKQRHFARLQGLTGEAGARDILAANRLNLVCVCADNDVLADIDTPEALDQIKGWHRQ